MRETRAAARRRLATEHDLTTRQLGGILSKMNGTLHDARHNRPTDLRRLALALDAHDPQRILQRGYALVQAAESNQGLADAGRARPSLRFSDGIADVGVTAPGDRTSPSPHD